MALHLVMRITFLLLLTYELAEAAPPVAKSNCKSSCGNVKIPYLFGIGPNCYMDKWFEVVCIGTGSSAKAFLTRIEKEVLQIDIMTKFPRSNHTYGPTVKVQMPTIYTKNCNSTGNMSPVSITGSPFNFSAYFKF
ncbi:wall-associated receptor kinase-like 10 [Castanea sativa]|uniref:wall-associated receptor kinase-like 10 n=1 Tax=Castanea sativa TaxID=21020 RepID=UPI003F64CE62